MKYITVHCSATKEGQVLHAADIDKWHKAKGWSGIGYHYVITLGGEIEQGRSITRTGAHVGGHNINNIGICLVGGLDKNGKPKNTFTVPQFNALKWLIEDLVGNFGIPLENIKGHRDWSPDKNGDGIINKTDWLKDCPCFSVKDKLQEWRA